MRIVQQPGGEPVSSQTLLSLVTQALLHIGGPIVCNPVPNSQYSALWQTVTVRDATFVGCSPNITQIARNATAGKDTVPPTLQCTAPGNDPTTPAAKAQLNDAVGVALRAPEVQPIISTDALQTYLVAVMADVLGTGSGGTATCAQAAMLTNSVNLDGALFAYPSFGQCAQCIRTGNPSGDMPVCLSISQTLAHPMMQCMSRGLTFDEAPPTGGGGTGGDPNPTPTSTKHAHIRTILIVIGAIVLCVAIVWGIAAGVRRHGSSKRSS